MQLACPHHQQADDDGQVADRVEEEQRRDADGGDEDAGDRRADDARAVEDRAVERNGISDVVTTDHLDHERLAKRHVEGVHDAEQEGQHEHLPDLHGVRQHEQPEHQGEHGCAYLRPDQRGSLVDRVCEHAGEQAQHEHRRELGRRDNAQGQRIAGQLQHQPRLGHALHPGPGE